MKLLSLIKKSCEYSDVDSFLSFLIRETVDFFDSADAGIIYLFDKDRKQLISRAVLGYPEKATLISLKPGEGLPGQCLALGKPLLLTSALKIERECSDTLTAKNLKYYLHLQRKLPPILSAVAAPLAFLGKSLGVIILEHHDMQTRKFNRTDLEKLEFICLWSSQITECLRLDQNLKDSNRSYRELLGKFLASNEAERKRIAREIHDEINHILLSVKLNLEDMGNSLPPDMIGSREKLITLQKYVGRAFDELHRLSFDLRPPGLDELGLPQALDWYITTISQDSGLPIKFEIIGMQYRKPAPVVETALLRIAQESLSNTIKHANASSARVKLHYTEHNLSLEVEDNGIGFNTRSLLDIHASTNNLGLLGMRERAEMCGGELNFISSPGNGTRIITRIPIDSYNWGTY